MRTSKIIGLLGMPQEQSGGRLLSALSDLFSVEFRFITTGEPSECDAYIQFIEPGGLHCVLELKHPTLIFCGGNAPLENRQLAIGLNAMVPREFQGLRCSRKSRSVGNSYIRPDKGEVIAMIDDQPFWVVARSKSGARVDLVSSGLAVDEPVRFLFQKLDSDAFSLIPLITFLRRLTEDDDWVPPPPRACLMFDDPNLHWKTYGYLDYRELADNAEKHNYHASFATIPLDAALVNQGALSILKANEARISLLVHGNNHTTNELAQSRSMNQSVRLVAQALRRIEGFERRTGLSVSRVMAAPHGACSEQTMQAMLLLGFEGACISRGSLMKHNPTHNWSAATGFFPVEFLGGGFPVIPRFRISRDNHFNIALAAFLHQPIVPVGHHEDVAEGLDLLEFVSSQINSLPDVRWMTMAKIARANYFSRIKNSALSIYSHSRQIQVQVNDGISAIELKQAWPEPEGGSKLVVHWNNQELRAEDASSTYRIPGPGFLQACWRSPRALSPEHIPDPAFQPWALVRRALAEGRDRVRPLIRRKPRGSRKDLRKHGGNRAEAPIGT